MQHLGWKRKKCIGMFLSDGMIIHVYKRPFVLGNAGSLQCEMIFSWVYISDFHFAFKKVAKKEAQMLACTGKVRIFASVFASPQEGREGLLRPFADKRNETGSPLNPTRKEWCICEQSPVASVCRCDGTEKMRVHHRESVLELAVHSLALPSNTQGVKRSLQRGQRGKTIFIVCQGENRLPPQHAALNQATRTFKN